MDEGISVTQDDDTQMTGVLIQFNATCISANRFVTVLVCVRMLAEYPKVNSSAQNVFFDA
jgi:hypothetical protein